MNKFGILLLGLAAVTVMSCKKYEDGPNFSLKREYNRVTNKWRVNVAYSSEFTDTPENGENQTDIWSNFIIEFFKDDTYKLENTNFTTQRSTLETGDWKFIDDKLKIETTGTEIVTSTVDNSLISETEKTTIWRIQRLKRNEFWVWYQNADTPPWIYFRFQR